MTRLVAVAVAVCFSGCAAPPPLYEKLDSSITRLQGSKHFPVCEAFLVTHDGMKTKTTVEVCVDE